MAIAHRAIQTTSCCAVASSNFSPIPRATAASTEGLHVESVRDGKKQQIVKTMDKKYKLLRAANFWTSSLRSHQVAEVLVALWSGIRRKLTHPAMRNKHRISKNTSSVSKICTYCKKNKSQTPAMCWHSKLQASTKQRKTTSHPATILGAPKTGPSYHRIQRFPECSRSSCQHA